MASSSLILPVYKVTKHFTAGILEGLTIDEITTVKFDIGFDCKKPCAGSPYKITGCEQIGTKTI